jgi:hypothetical protein
VRSLRARPMPPGVRPRCRRARAELASPDRRSRVSSWGRRAQRGAQAVSVLVAELEAKDPLVAMTPARSTIRGRRSTSSSISERASSDQVTPVLLEPLRQPLASGAGLTAAPALRASAPTVATLTPGLDEQEASESPVASGPLRSGDAGADRAQVHTRARRQIRASAGMIARHSLLAQVGLRARRDALGITTQKWSMMVTPSSGVVSDGRDRRGDVGEPIRRLMRRLVAWLAMRRVEGGD